MSTRNDPLTLARERLAELVREPQATPARKACPGRGRRWALDVLLCLLGAWATSRALAFLIDRVPGATLEVETALRVKSQYFDLHRDEFDLVFVGSSRVYYQVIPRLFDQRMASYGVPTTSFNMGVPGMYFPETRHVVERLLARHPKRLRWLVIELQDLERVIIPVDRLTRRMIHWHTPGLTTLAAEVAWRADSPWSERRARIADHLLHGAYRFANLGNGLPALRAACGGDPRAPDASTWMDGFVALEQEPKNRGQIEASRRRFLAQTDDVARRLASRGAGPERPRDPLLERELGDLVQLVRAAGVEPIFLIAPPLWEERGDLERLAADGIVPALLSYDDPERFPEFYAVPNLFDFGHLNLRGSEVFSARLAADLSDLLGD